MPHHLIDPTHPRTRLVLQVIAYAATAALVVGAIVLGIAIYQLSEATRQTQIANTARTQADRARDEQTAQLARDAALAASRIEDCTTPGRDCFRESQERLRETVGTINDNTNDAATAAAYCADQPGAQTIVELEVCIRARLEAADDDQPQENR